MMSEDRRSISIIISSPETRPWRSEFLFLRAETRSPAIEKAYLGAHPIACRCDDSSDSFKDPHSLIICTASPKHQSHNFSERSLLSKSIIIHRINRRGIEKSPLNAIDHLDNDAGRGLHRAAQQWSGEFREVRSERLRANQNSGNEDRRWALSAAASGAPHASAFQQRVANVPPSTANHVQPILDLLTRNSSLPANKTCHRQSSPTERLPIGHLQLVPRELP